MAARDSLEEKLPAEKKIYVFLWGCSSKRGGRRQLKKKKGEQREIVIWGNEATEGEDEVENLDT